MSDKAACVLSLSVSHIQRLPADEPAKSVRQIEGTDWTSFSPVFRCIAGRRSASVS